MDREKEKERVRAIGSFYRTAGRMPTFSEVGELVGLASKNAVTKLVKRLEEHGVLARDDKGRLVPRSLAHPFKLLGTVEAGFPSPAEEETADNISLDELLIQNPDATFLLKVAGDSMSGAGIMPGDMVIVDRALSPKNGDVVIAEVDGAWTMKFLEKNGESVVLMAANPKYKPITPRKELKVAGVVTGVVRKYR